MENFWFFIEKIEKFEFVEKKSKFITHLIPASSEDEAILFVKNIVKKEKGATHNCFAYRILDKDKNIIERKNDDNEPAGTAGSPILSVLTGENLINIVAIVTRYFGGIKLGTGGLVSSYKKGVIKAIENATKKEFIFTIEREFKFSIKDIKHYDYLFKKRNIKIVSKNFSDMVTYTARGTENDFSKIEEELRRIDQSNLGNICGSPK